MVLAAPILRCLRLGSAARRAIARTDPKGAMHHVPELRFSAKMPDVLTVVRRA